MDERIILENLGRMIDISGVRTDVTLHEVEQIVAAAKHYRFICAFVMPCFTPRLVDMLKDSPDIRVGGTVGFPSGADTTTIKVQNAKEQLAAGADELDMVINVGALKSGLYGMGGGRYQGGGRRRARQADQMHSGVCLPDRR